MTVQENSANMTTMPAIKPGQSLLEASMLSGKNTWLLAELNRLPSPNMAMPMDTYYMPSAEANASNLALPGIRSIVLDNLPLRQGETFLIKVESDQPVTVQADLASIQPVFVDLGGVQMAYGGINALTEPGVYPLNMKVTYPDGVTYNFDQLVMINSSRFPTDEPLEVDPNSIGTEAEKAENAVFKSIVEPITTTQQWSGLWYSPAQDADCIISAFGSRRTYNDDPRVFYHTGLDLGWCKGTDVYAAARGTVVGVFPDQVVRGNTIVIDHGLGVYTIYMHLEEILVSQGGRRYRVNWHYQRLVVHRPHPTSGYSRHARSADWWLFSLNKKEHIFALFVCAERELNPHALRHVALNHACLPIPAPAQT